MSSRGRVKALETKLTPPDERRCYLIVDEAEDGRRWPSKCPLGLELDRELSQCESCSIRPENRTRLMIVWVPGISEDER